MPSSGSRTCVVRPESTPRAGFDSRTSPPARGTGRRSSPARGQEAPHEEDRVICQTRPRLLSEVVEGAGHPKPAWLVSLVSVTPDSGPASARIALRGHRLAVYAPPGPPRCVRALWAGRPTHRGVCVPSRRSWDHAPPLRRSTGSEWRIRPRTRRRGPLTRRGLPWASERFLPRAAISLLDSP